MVIGISLVMGIILLPPSIHFKDNKDSIEVVTLKKNNLGYDSQNSEANHFEPPFADFEEDDGDFGEQRAQPVADPFEWWTEINYNRLYRQLPNASRL